MTLDEAIKHAEEVAEKCDIRTCAEEHRQLVIWLKQLKALTEGSGNVYESNNCVCQLKTEPLCSSKVSHSCSFKTEPVCSVVRAKTCF